MSELRDEIKAALKDAGLETYVLRNWLQKYEPYVVGEDYDDLSDVTFMTSADIVNELADMVNLSLNDVAHEMVSKGFYIGESPDHRPCWIMARRER